MPAPQAQTMDVPQQGGRQRQQAGPEARIHYLQYKNFETMDTQQSRVGLKPDRLAWLENLQPIGTNDLVQVPGPAAALVSSTGKTAQKIFYATYGGVDYAIYFNTDGSAQQINLAGGAIVTIAGPGTFSNADMAQWASDRILIADPTAGYSEWDGAVFVKAGGVSPNIIVTAVGSGYSSAPSVTISGGSGSGATAVASVAGGSVTAVTLTAAGTGYKAGDTLTVTFGGPGTGAAATAKVWPILVFPNLSSIAVFQGRVWLAGNRVLQWTGTTGFDDVNPANAAGSTILSDSDLPHTITALRSLNNFLLIAGDGSIKQIGAISVASGVTVFTIITLSSDQGTTFPLTIIAYNRLVLFTNFVGVWALFGATVEKISSPMDGVWRLLDFTQTPQACSININNQRCALLCVKYNDPAGPRSIFLTFMARKWFVISQNGAEKGCIDATIGGVSTVFTTSGSDVTQILASTTTATQIFLQTALADGDKSMQNKRMIRLGIVQQAGPGTGVMNLTFDSENGIVSDQYTFALGVTWINGLGQVITWQNSALSNVIFTTGGFFFQEKQANASGIYLGASFKGTFTGYHFNAVVIEYEDGAPMRSRNRT